MKKSEQDIIAESIDTHVAEKVGDSKLTKMNRIVQKSSRSSMKSYLAGTAAEHRGDVEGLKRNADKFKHHHKRHVAIKPQRDAEEKAQDELLKAKLAASLHGGISESEKHGGSDEPNARATDSSLTEGKTVHFNKFSVHLPHKAISDCSHSGSCDAEVDHWHKKLNLKIDPTHLKNELKEYGAWGDRELKDHQQNLKRILWIAAGNASEERN